MYRVHVKQFSHYQEIDAYLAEHPTYTPMNVQWLNGVCLLACREQVGREKLTLNKGGPKRGKDATNN